MTNKLAVNELHRHTGQSLFAQFAALCGIGSLWPNVLATVDLLPDVADRSLTPIMRGIAVDEAAGVLKNLLEKEPHFKLISLDTSASLADQVGCLSAKAMPAIEFLNGTVAINEISGQIYFGRKDLDSRLVEAARLLWLHQRKGRDLFVPLPD